MSAFKDKGMVIASIQKLIAGLKQHFAGQTLTFDNTKLSTDEIVARLQRRIDDLESADVANRQWKAALQKVDDGQDESDSLVSGVHRYIRALFGPANADVRDFGIEPFHARSVTLDTKVAAREKGQQTREARHTMGRRQREAIHGSVPAPVQPVQAPSPVPSPSPAPVTAATQPTQPATSSSVPATPATPTDKAA